MTMKTAARVVRTICAGWVLISTSAQGTPPASMLAIVAGAQQTPDSRYKEAWDLFNNSSPERGDLERSCSLMKELTTQYPADEKYNQGEKVICGQRDEMLKSEQDEYKAGVNAAKAGNCGEARDRLAAINRELTSNPRYRDALDKTVAACREPKPAQTPAKLGGGALKQQGPGSPEQPSVQSGSDQSLRDGLNDYFNGEFDKAKQELTEYVGQKGGKLPLALFFRGAAEGAQYLLGGEKNNQIEELAKADFRDAKKGLSPTMLAQIQGLVPPRIWAMYQSSQ